MEAEYFIKIDSWKGSVSNKDFFEHEIFYLLCLSNLPIGTRIVISKGMRLNTVLIDTLENIVIHDTMTISNEKFEVPFPVKYTSAGYILFKMLPKEQAPAKTYYWEYSIGYKRRMTKNGVSIPELPVKIIVSNITI